MGLEELDIPADRKVSYGEHNPSGIVVAAVAGVLRPPVYECVRLFLCELGAEPDLIADPPRLSRV